MVAAPIPVIGSSLDGVGVSSEPVPAAVLPSDEELEARPDNGAEPSGLE